MNSRRYTLRTTSLILTAFLCPLLATPGEPDTPHLLPTSDSPLGATARLLVSYESRSLDDYAALLLPRFRFVFGDPELRAAHPDGFSREDELASASHLFTGFTDASGVARPSARAIDIDLDTVWVEDEPEKPDSSAHYRVVFARGLSLNIALEDGTGLVVPPACHHFHMMRGDAAARDPDQPGDADHWYLWRWVESPSCDEVPLAAGATSRPPLPARAVASGVPTILGAPSPAHGAVTLLVRLPGPEPARLHVFDVSGRRVLEADLGAPKFAVATTTVDGAASLPAGVYWMRLTQGVRTGPARAIVLR